MTTIIIIFMIVATIFAIATLVYVAIDLILELRKKKESEEEDEEQEAKPVVVAAPIAEKGADEAKPEPEIIESAPVIISKDMPAPVSAKSGVEVIDVAWPESMAKNKIYKYDPNGATVKRGDTVLVPTFDAYYRREVLRTATVINGNYRVDAIPAGKILKKIIRVIK